MSDQRSLIIRVGLLYLTIGAAVVGLWATIAPRGFYDDFPGGGRVWVAIDGPYNEHLVRDVGAFELGLVILGVAAVIVLSRDLVRVALLAFFVSGVPHAIYHLRHSDPGGKGDIAGVISVVTLPLAALALLIFSELASSRPGTRPAGQGRSGSAG